MAILIVNYVFADLLFSLCLQVFLAPCAAWLYCICSLAMLIGKAGYTGWLCSISMLPMQVG